MKPVLKIVLFAVALLGILYTLSIAFRDNNGYTARTHAFYGIDDRPTEVIIFGNSHGMSSFHPSILNTQLEVTTFNLSQSGQKLPVTYYYIKEAIRVNKPQLFVLELFTTWTESQEKHIPLNILSLRALDPSFNKLQATFSYLHPQYYLETLFPAIGNHADWSDPEQLSKNLSSRSRLSYPYQSGFFAGNTVLSPQFMRNYGDPVYMPDARFSRMSDENVAVLKDIIALCEEHEVELLLTLAPMVSEYLRLHNFKVFQRHIDSIAQAHNVRFLDLNAGYEQESFDRTFFVNEFKNYHHVNVTGATYSSLQLADYIDQHFNVTREITLEEHLQTIMLMPEFYQLGGHTRYPQLNVAYQKHDGVEVIYDRDHKNTFLNLYKAFEQLRGGQLVFEYEPVPAYKDRRNLLKGKETFKVYVPVKRPGQAYPYEAKVQRVNYPGFPIRLLRVYPKGQENRPNKTWEIVLDMRPKK